MADLTPFPLAFSDYVEAAVWLTKYDSKPRLLPRWPGSRRMTLVGVAADDSPAAATKPAYVITDPAQLGPALELRQLCWLFFSVPRSAVLESDTCPEGLTAETWVDVSSERKKTD